MKIGEMMRADESHRFVGRRRELETLSRLLRADADEWRFIRLHGTRGIGKTALLKHFDALHARDAICLYIDCSSYRSVWDLLDDLEERLSSDERCRGIAIDPSSKGRRKAERAAAVLNAACSLGRLPVVLLLDALEQDDSRARALSSWFMLLDRNIKAVSAGVYPFEGFWRNEGLHGFIRHLRLAPLAPEEQDAFFSLHGIGSPELREAIAEWAGGFPLALRLSADSIARSEGDGYLHGLERARLSGCLVERLVLDPSRPELFKLAEASAMLSYFNEERLSLALGTEISILDFSGFVRSPYVAQIEEGWTLDDAIRRWIVIDTKRRKPNAYEKMKARIAEQALDRPAFAFRGPDTIATEARSRAVSAVGQLLLYDRRLAEYPEVCSEFVSCFPELQNPTANFKETIDAARQFLRRGLRQMCGQSEQSLKLGKLLEHAYLLGERTHEKTAERFGYSLSTYYRALKKAKSRLTDAMFELQPPVER